VAPPPSGTVTFLFTDLEGSSRLWEQCPDAMPAALARHDKILDEAIVGNRGRVFSTAGDGRAAAFATAGDAMAAALAAQHELRAEEWGTTGPLQVRMGLHTGPVEARDGDYLGSTVNRAARLMAVAHGGQVVCSKATAEVTGGELPEGAHLIDLGEHRLRDLARPEHVLQLAHPTLRCDFPPLSSLDAYPTNLPIHTSAFVGRERQLAEVAAALGESRIVTLTGVGGVGKTRLALQVAAELLPHYRDGAWLVELGPTVDPEAVPEVVTASLEVTQRQGRSIINTLLDFLAWKRALVVLDNCEHLLDAVAGLVEQITRACPQVAILATSREGLGVDGEHIMAVPSLDLPSEDGELEAVADAEAVRLFVQRARQAKADFGLSADNAPTVAGLCRRLDGVALAIELAAARVRSLTPAELSARLDDRFRLLAGGRRTAVERHRTLRRAVDWSYDLLPEAEQLALRRLSVFAGSFSLEGAEAVVGGDGIQAAEVVDLLGHLVDKSLLVAEADGVTTRYRLLETIRQYAEDRLEVSGHAEAFRRRHAERYAAFATEAKHGLRSPDAVAWTRQAEAELDNLRTALGWSVATGDVDLALRLVTPLASYGTRIGYATSSWGDPVVAMVGASDHPLYPEALAWVARAPALGYGLEHAAALAGEALALADARRASAPTICRVLNATAALALMRGAIEQAIAESERSVSLARSTGDDYELVLALAMSSSARRLDGEIPGAIEEAEEALTRARSLGNPHALSVAALVAGTAQLGIDPHRALELLDLATESGASVGSEITVGTALNISAAIRLEQGDWREAARTNLRAFDQFRRAGDQHSMALAVVGLTVTLTSGGADEAAAVLSGAFDTAMPGPLAEQESDAVATLESRLGEEHFAELAGRGAAMSQDELLAFIADKVARLLAENDDEPTSNTTRGRNEFRREADVWLLTYEGRSCRLKDAKGLQYLAALLTRQGREVHVFDLVGSGAAGGGTGEPLDAQAKIAYRQRLSELEAEEAEATEWGDSERADRARVEAQTITAELAAAYGLGGRPRGGTDPTERARKAVANRIRDSLARIDEAHAALGRHLRNSVHTGTFCSYQPERSTIWNRGESSS
jgi:predicted ATPase/class 3 adenylate cyclase